MILATIAAAASIAPGAQFCTPPSGWAAVDARPERVIVFGEEHGTREAPALVGEIACKLTTANRPVLVAIELSASTNAALQRLWATSTKGFRDRVIAELPGFAGREDGVASVAMLDLIDRLHGLAYTGHAVDIVAFNGFRDAAQKAEYAALLGQGPHEAAQAANIAAAARLKHYDRVIILTGSFHARKRPFVDDPQMEPMAVRLNRAMPVISLLQQADTGTAWNCVRVGGNIASGTGHPECGIHGSFHTIGPDHREGLSLIPPPNEDADAYDGIFHLPVTHGSPPAARIRVGSRSRRD